MNYRDTQRRSQGVVLVAWLVAAAGLVVTHREARAAGGLNFVEEVKIGVAPAVLGCDNS